MKRAIVFGIVLSVLSLTFGLGYAETPQAPAAESVELSELSAQAVVGQITCAIQTITGNFLTAVGGGGRTTDVLHTDATIIDAWEKFTLIDAGDGSYGLRTVNGHYLTAVGGGGRITDVIHSDAVNLLGWEKFTAYALGNGYYAIATISGRYLTAVGGGGRTTDTMHSDATGVGAWEKFRFICLVGVGD